MPRNLLVLTLASVLASATAASAADYAVEQEAGFMPGAEQEAVAVEEDDSLIDVNIDLGLFDDDEEEVVMTGAPDEPDAPLPVE
jgi:hypothetical protein